MKCSEQQIYKNKNEMNGGLGLGKGLIATEMREFIAVMKKKKEKKCSQMGLW